MERKLVSIQRIEALAPIAGADQIEQARVMGWTVVVKKGEFQPGDPCVFFEIDSVLPKDAPWAEFMKARGFRIRTLKLRGVLSQGLALPISILGGGQIPPLGMDIRDRLGVSKYEAQLPDSREIAGSFPSLVPKTDEIRLQSALGVLDEIRGRDFYISTKLDGSSVTYFREPDGQFIACSRNWALARPSGVATNSVWRVAERHGLENKLPPGIAIQAELCGPGIQKNRLGLSETDCFVFSVYDAKAGQYLDYQSMMDFCKEQALRTVPIEHEVRGEEARAFEHTLENWLEKARGLYPGTKNRKEGIVVRGFESMHSSTLGGRLSFKVINNDFLLKDED